jgi:CBS domain-containing protein
MAVKVSAVMTKDVATVEPDRPFKRVVSIMLEHDVSGVPVVRADGELVGIITRADLIAKAGRFPPKSGASGMLDFLLAGPNPTLRQRAEALTASEVMTGRVITVEPDDDVVVAARRMLTYGIDRLPVVEDGRLVGIVSRRDVLKVFVVPDAVISDEARRAVPDGVDIEVDVRDGVVHLSGPVGSAADAKALAARMAGITGVVGVDDQLVHS